MELWWNKSVNLFLIWREHCVDNIFVLVHVYAWSVRKQYQQTKGVAKVVQFHLSRGVIFRHQSFHWTILQYCPIRLLKTSFLPLWRSEIGYFCYPQWLIPEYLLHQPSLWTHGYHCKQRANNTTTCNQHGMVTSHTAFPQFANQQNKDHCSCPISCICGMKTLIFDLSCCTCRRWYWVTGPSCLGIPRWWEPCHPPVLTWTYTAWLCKSSKVTFQCFLWCLKGSCLCPCC